MRRLLTAALIMAGVPAIYLASVLFVFTRNACERWETTLVRDDRGRAVVSTLESCVFAGNDQWVDLVLPSGHHERVFDFTEGQPSATWVTPNVLQISIGTVDGIGAQRTEVDGVRVVYDIGANLPH
jgi:hypothetical protein